MNEYLPFVTIDVWTMIFTLVNLVILFLLLKHFLFKPINDILSAREDEIEGTYNRAEETEITAEEKKTEYEKRLVNLTSEADEIISTATKTAQIRAEAIISESKEQAEILLEKSKKQIEQEKRTAVTEARAEIASMVILASQHLIKKRLDANEDEEMIADIIDRIQVK